MGQDTILAKSALLFEQGIDDMPDLIDVEQNAILLKQGESDIKRLLGLENKLDAIHPES